MLRGIQLRHCSGPNVHSLHYPSSMVGKLCARASLSLNSVKQSQKTISIGIPETQDQAVNDAVLALKAKLLPLVENKKTVKRGFASSVTEPMDRFSIEIPLADTSAPQIVNVISQMISGLLQAKPRLDRSDFTLVFADKATAERARGQAGLAGRVLQLSEAGALAPCSLAGVLVVVAPRNEELAVCVTLLDSVWRGPAAVVFNPGWAEARVDSQFADFVGGIQVVYSFMPIAIKGLLGSREGAVLHVASEKSTPQWKIVQMNGSEFVQVGQTKKRPSPEDLELIFMNAAASASPLTKAASALNSTMKKLTGKK